MIESILLTNYLKIKSITYIYDNCLIDFDATDIARELSMEDRYIITKCSDNE